MLFGKLLPREGNFFELFDEHGKLIAEGARAFMAMVQYYNDPALREKYAIDVDNAEKQADRITAEVNRLLHKTFITPIDREQIHGLINAMDDILDLLQDSAEVMHLYDLKSVSEDVARLGDISAKCCERVQHAVSLLPDKPALQGPRALRVNAVEFARDGSRTAAMLRSVDNKDRWIVEVQADETLQLRHRLTDPAWINWGFNEFGCLPDNRTLWYLSEEDGHAHFYTREGQRKPKQHTRGAFEVSAPQISADGQHVWLLGNRAWPGDYEVYRLDLGNDQLSEVTALDGVESFQLSPDQAQLLISWSSSYLPTQIAVLPAAGGEARPLTDTRSTAFKAVDWLPPQYVQVTSKHGAGTIRGKFYRPATLEPGKRYPIVMFVHGAGYLQNVSARYPAYFREQMFHNLLVSQGYLVLDLDYRASEGYGRDWRTAIYRQMGHPELEDYH